MQINHQIAGVLHCEIHRIADHQSAGGHDRLREAAEGQHPAGARDDAGPSVPQRDLCCADAQRRRAEGVGQHDPDARTTHRDACDLSQGLVLEVQRRRAPDRQRLRTERRRLDGGRHVARP